MFFSFLLRQHYPRRGHQLTRHTVSMNRYITVTIKSLPSAWSCANKMTRATSALTQGFEVWTPKPLCRMWPTYLVPYVRDVSGYIKDSSVSPWNSKKKIFKMVKQKYFFLLIYSPFFVASKRLLYWSIKTRNGSAPKPKRKKIQRVFYGTLWVLVYGFHTKVVKLCKFKGVSSNRGPAILWEVHRDVFPERLAIQRARRETTLEWGETHPLKTRETDPLKSVS